MDRLEFSIECLEVLEGNVTREGEYCPKMFLYHEPGPEVKLDRVQKGGSTEMRNWSLMDMEDVTLVAERPSTSKRDTSPGRERTSSTTALHEAPGAVEVERLGIDTNAKPARGRKASNTIALEANRSNETRRRTSGQEGDKQDSGEEDVDIDAENKGNDGSGILANTRTRRGGVRQPFAWLLRAGL